MATFGIIAMRNWFAAFVVIGTISLATSAFGDEVAYSFEGTVDILRFPPFGIEAPTPLNVTGRFIYETESVATHFFDGCDCVGYRQQIVGGFSVNFGDVHVRADDYVLRVENDTPEEDGLVDRISVRFADNFEPPLTAPLNVNGVEHSLGDFFISLQAGSDLFSSTALPITFDEDQASGVLVLTDTTDLLPQPNIPNIVSLATHNLTSALVQTGDYNFDGIVNGVDYDVWIDAFGSTSDLSADGNRNGVVDAADFTVWQDASNFATSVPEPNGFGNWLMASILIVCNLLSRRNVRHDGHRDQ